MAYHIHNLAYRHDNGEHEGFAGTSLSGPEDARRHAIGKAIAKCESIGRTFDPGRIIESDKGLSREVYDQLREDWQISRRSGRI